MTRSFSFSMLTALTLVIAGCGEGQIDSYDDFEMEEEELRKNKRQNPICGNGVLEQGEQCDGEACCSASCTFQSAGTVCRGAASSCDRAETCSGAGALCPADQRAPDGTSCTGGTCRAGACVASTTTCVDPDSDGYGAGCAAGPDCDSTSASRNLSCPATFTWSAPVNADGTLDTRVVGYRLYIGASSGAYTRTSELGAPSCISTATGRQCTSVLNGFAAGPHFFAVTAYDGSGNESLRSNEASKLFQ